MAETVLGLPPMQNYVLMETMVVANNLPGKYVFFIVSF